MPPAGRLHSINALVSTPERTRSEWLQAGEVSETNKTRILAKPRDSRIAAVSIVLVSAAFLSPVCTPWPVARSLDDQDKEGKR